MAIKINNEALTGATIDADSNTLTNIENADIKAAAAIDRSKLASGTASHVLTNDGSGVMSSEAQLVSAKGGTGVNNAGTLTYGSNNITLTTSGITSITLPTTGTLSTLAGSETLSSKTLTAPDINGGTADSLTSLSIRDTSAAFDVVLAATSSTALGANRTITIDVDNSARTLALKKSLTVQTGDITLSGNGAGSSLTLPASGTLATLAGTEVLTGKTLTGNTATNLINGVGTFNINSSGTITAPNATDTLVGKATTDTLTNKTFDADGTGNSITNIENADIKAAAAIAVNKLAAVTASRALTSDASGFIAVSATTSSELAFVNGVTSAIQTQLDGKVAGPGSSTDNAIVRFDATTGKIVQNSSVTIDDTNNMAGVVNVTADGNLIANVAGKGFKVKEGSNATMGTAILVAGTATVATTAVTANSRIFLTSQSDGGTVGFLRITARNAAQDFTITSSNNADTSTVAWIIIEPA